MYGLNETYVYAGMVLCFFNRLPGIQQAMMRLYKLDGSNKKNLQIQMLSIAEKWKPYRTYACRYLWDWKDNEPSPKKKKSVKKN